MLDDFSSFISFYSDDESALESSFDNVNTNRKYKESDFTQVYVLLFRGSAFLSRVIEIASGDYFSHAAISFDTKMQTCYSFSDGKLKGEHKVGGKMVQFGNRAIGFTIQNVHADVFKKQPGQINVVFVTHTEKRKLRERLKYYLDNAAKQKYNVGNFLKILAKVPDKTANARICSSFVSEILNSGDSMRTKYEDSLNRPQSLQSALDCFSVWSGQFGNYNEKTVIENTAKWKKKYVAILNEK